MELIQDLINMKKLLLIFILIIISLIGFSQSPSVTPSVTIQMNGIINVKVLMIDKVNMGYLFADTKIFPAFNYTLKVIDTVSFTTVKCEDFKCPPIKEPKYDWNYRFIPDSVLLIQIPCNGK